MMLASLAPKRAIVAPTNARATKHASDTPRKSVRVGKWAFKSRIKEEPRRPSIAVGQPFSWLLVAVILLVVIVLVEIGSIVENNSDQAGVVDCLEPLL